MDPNIKMVKIINSKEVPAEVEMGAIESTGGGKGTRKREVSSRRKTQKVLQVGEITKLSGGAQAASPGTAVQLAASRVPPSTQVPGAPEPVGVDSAATQKAAVLTVAKGGAPAAAAAATPVKVVLAAPKKKKSTVVLAAAPKSQEPVVAVKVSSGGATRKAGVHKARKIKVSMKTLRKKIHKAKTIRKSAEGTSLEQIKKELQKAGIIKAESKAPESILRQMYADFMTLKSRAL